MECLASGGHHPTYEAPNVRRGKDRLPLEHGLHAMVWNGRGFEPAERTMDEGRWPRGAGTGKGTGGHRASAETKAMTRGERGQTGGFKMLPSRKAAVLDKGGKALVQNRMLLLERCMS